MKRYRIAEICTLVKGLSPTLKTEPGEYPLVVTAAYRRTASTYQLDRPSVCIPLVSSTGHGDAALHRVHYQDGKYAVANLLVALVPNDHAVCNPKYLYHLLNTKRDELLVPLMQGTANVSLKIDDIAAVEIPLPPLAEQRRIVAKIDQLAAKIAEARGLQNDAADAEERLLVAMAHRADIDEVEKARLGWKQIVLREVLAEVADPVRPEPDKRYPNLGIYSFARGLFPKQPIDGLTTSAATLCRVRAGQFIYSRLFAFEGAYGIVTGEFDGSYVSNEYPTFSCDGDRILPEFLFAYFKSPRAWAAVATGSKGLGQPRQRGTPERLLSHQLMLPTLDWQQRIVDVHRKVAQLKQLQAQTAAELDALLPAILDKAFKGDL